MGEVIFSSTISKAVNRPVVSAPTENILTRTVERYWTWRERHRTRYQLVSMSDGMLKDIGLSRGEVELEYEKHFWQR